MTKEKLTPDWVTIYDMNTQLSFLPYLKDQKLNGSKTNVV